MFTFGKIRSYNQHRVTSENLWGKQKLKLLKLMKLIVVHCLKKHANFETVQLEIIRIDFDGIWQKYSKYSRTEFVCFMLQFLCRFVFYQLIILSCIVSNLAHFLRHDVKVVLLS